MTELMDAETEVLLSYLDAQRDHVLGILDGLSDEELHRPVLPSGWSCLGMVKHLALAHEHYWFRCIVAGESLGFFPEERNAEWRIEPGETTAGIFGLYRDENEHTNAIIAATPLLAAPRQRDPVWDGWGINFTDLRSIILHVIAETAVHAGHVDAARELIDGRQWVVI
jgi:hypothetical protein